MTVVLSRRRVSVVVALALVVLALMLRQETHTNGAVSASAPPITGQCAGSKQGLITGDVTLKGREGTYAISSLTHGIAMLRDAASGQATGRRQHKPLTFVTNVSRATPQLITALDTNESLKKCVFNFWRTTTVGGTAKEANYFRITLSNARVSAYALAGAPGGADRVTFSLDYQKIEWTYVDGGITSVDDWETPGA